MIDTLIVVTHVQLQKSHAQSSTEALRAQLLRVELLLIPVVKRHMIPPQFAVIPVNKAGEVHAAEALAHSSPEERPRFRLFELHSSCYPYTLGGRPQSSRANSPLPC